MAANDTWIFYIVIGFFTLVSTAVSLVAIVTATGSTDPHLVGYCVRAVERESTVAVPRHEMSGFVRIQNDGQHMCYNLEYYFDGEVCAAEDCTGQCTITEVGVYGKNKVSVGTLDSEAFHLRFFLASDMASLGRNGTLAGCKKLSHFAFDTPQKYYLRVKFSDECEYVNVRDELGQVCRTPQHEERLYGDGGSLRSSSSHLEPEQEDRIVLE